MWYRSLVPIRIYTHIYILCTVYIIWLYFWTQMKPIWGCKSLQMVVPNIFGRKMDLLWRNIILPAALLGCDVVVWIQKMCRKADSIHWWIIIFQIETTIKWGGQSHFQAHKKSHPSYQVGCSMVFPLYPQYIPMISPLYGAIRYFMGVTRKKTSIFFGFSMK